MRTRFEDTWTFPFCPQPPDWKLDWDAIVDKFAWVREMESCPQDPIWHGEGNVLIHTGMVCEALVAMSEWRELPETERSIVFAATLMHDIAKPKVTCEIDGRIRAHRHAAKGSQMVRTLLLQELLQTTSCERLHMREQIVNLVRHHGLPLYLLVSRDPHRELFAASQIARCDWLAMIAMADVLGRHCENKNNLVEKVEMFREVANENQCWGAPRKFASAHTRHVYFQGRDLDPDCESFDDTTCEVIVMSGLPGAGKDHWLSKHGPDSPIISLDAIRGEFGVSAADDQAQVVKTAKDRAREMMRQEKSFVWNATNTSLQMRRQLIQLFRDYNARVKIVYVETSWDELLRRNRAREQKLPLEILEKLANKLEVPQVTECHEVEIEFSG